MLQLINKEQSPYFTSESKFAGKQIQNEFVLINLIRVELG